MSETCDAVARLKRLEVLLDRRFSIFGIRVGLDGLVGLVPVVGDVVTAGAGVYLMLHARQLGAGRWTMVRMAVNIGLDMTLGAIPLVGDIFDIGFRSNTKNVKLLIAELERRAGELRQAKRGQVLRGIAA